MLDALLSALRQYDMLSPGDRVTCAVSGGADSMALLWGLYLLKDKLGIDLQAAHFNHGLRGAESDRDEAHVVEFCHRFDIPLTLGRGAVIPGKKGLEAAARDARYGFLETIPGKIATAHTADDNAETVLMHLVRGTGLKGLGGIAPVRGRIVRPMLNVTRAQVIAFLEEYHVSYVTDSSNHTDAFLRNRLRRHVIPLLKAENPRLAQNLSAMAQRLREDEAALEVEQTEQLDVAVLLSRSPAVQNRMIGSFLRSCGVKEPDARHIEQVKALAYSDNPSARACLPGGVTVCRSYGKLALGVEENMPEDVILPCPGQVQFGAVRVMCKPGMGVSPVGRMVVRSRQAGDSIRLPGGAKSLKKLFIDRKIPSERRPLVAVVADDQGILAVEGFGYNLDRLTENGGVQIEFL